MAVKIKLTRLGKIRNPQYRIAVADSRTRREGRAIEVIGRYHPKEEPSLIEVDSERAQYWLSVGAQPTEPVLKLLKITGDWQKFKGLPGAEGRLKVAAPKPTTALLLNEVQVTGIFHTPRGWSAMVEASPLTPKLSYVIYPGENFFDGQLVAIEEGRLIFRREIVWTDGRRDKSVEIKPLRAPSPVEAMTAAKTAPAEAPTTEVAKPTPEKQ